MTRYIFDNSMTAHVWAQQEQDSGRSHNGNFYFEGRAIYSYGTHYVAGYVAPGPLYLTNGDSSSVTTNGKHMPAVRAALDYNRGEFANGGTVPNLTRLAGIFMSMASFQSGCGGLNKVEGLRAIARHMQGGDFPGVDMAALVLISGGMAPGKAPAKAKLIGERAAREVARIEAKDAARLLKQEARSAKYMAGKAPSVGATVRALLVKAAHASEYRKEWIEQDARRESKDAFTAAKAAKAMGWTRIAATCRAEYKAARVELNRYRDGRARFVARATVSDAVATVRAFVSDISGMKPNHHTAGDALKRAKAQRMLLTDLQEALETIAESPWAGRLKGKLAIEAGKARGMSQAYAARAGRLLQDAQQEACAAWRDTGARVPYGLGRLEDSEGGALLRVSGLARDMSGKITGGELVTSWAASVPLVHAIRAFRFLKLCRETGKAWAANGKTIQVGHFRIDSVDDRGNFRAACHRINWQEVEKIALQLGLSELAGADTTESRATA